MADILPPPPMDALAPSGLPATPSKGVEPFERDPDSEGLPARFGKYTLLRKLATGGMAELFLAIQKSVAGFEKLLVIKRILPAMNGDRAFLDMLLHEARIAATLSHPNIVQIYDLGQEAGTYYIAMEHVHGEDLRSIVRAMRKKGVAEFPLEHALSIMIGVCAGLAYAHEKHDLEGSHLGIVHRDISPQNVVVAFTGDVKIVDFGIAKSSSKFGDTKSGKLKGKVPYMSPEQARGEDLDHRSDVFAAGVMLFELTTGKRLFKGPSEYETLKLICDKDYPLPTAIRPGYPPELEAIVMKALAKDRSERFASAREMQLALEDFARQERIPLSTVALSEFMQLLFEDKLAAQKEAILQGKQLAEIIELQAERESMTDLSLLGRTGVNLPSTPASSHTVTDLKPHKAARSRAMLAVAGGSLAAFVVGASALAWVRANGTTAAATEAPVPRGSLLVETVPAGAALWVDGELAPQVTPTTLRQLPLGRSVDLRVTKDGFEQWKGAVLVAEGKPEEHVSVTLKAGTVRLESVVRPETAKASLALDGHPVEGTTLEGLSPGEDHTLVVSAPGFQDHTVTVRGNAFENKRVEVTLERTPDTRHASRAGATTVAAPAAATGGAPGKLNVSASGGWCNVAVDGVSKGPTPVAGVELSAGAHKVTCTAEGKGPMTASVVVPEGGTVRHKFTLLTP